MKIKVVTFLFLAIGSLLVTTLVLAQTAELTLRLSRDFGYGGFNNDIQGLFSMKISGPADLSRVVFYVDNMVIGEVTQAPFILQFNTDNYPLGVHRLYAIGYSTIGQQYKSNILTNNFVPTSEGTKIIIPILVIVLGAILLSLVVTMLLGRGRVKFLTLGEERKYNFGGGICPKCNRPFALPLYSMNLGFSKFTRCPYCGKWSVVRRESLAKLREAEKAELGWGKADFKEETEEEKLRRNLEESKYLGK
jgi:hypothetical protein